MSKLKNVWIISSDSQTALELVTAANTAGEHSVRVLAGNRADAVGADEVLYLGEVNEATRWSDYISSTISLLKENQPELILCGTGKNDRLAAGRIAAALGADIITDVAAMKLNDAGEVMIERMVYGGAAILTAKNNGSALVLCIGNGVFAAAEATTAEVKDIAAVPSEGVKCLGVKPKTGTKVNLAQAKKVVGVGRGISDEDLLKQVQELCSVMDADLGCTRPIAEEAKWLPRERYIGVSGIMLKPELYLALGISGQVQHTVGISNAGTIVAVNKDKGAPIFQCADYGIVGDVKKILPMLIEKLK